MSVESTVTDTAAVAAPGRRGVALALLSAALFGVSAPLAKLLLQGVAPQLLAGILYVGSGTGLAVVLLFRRRRTGEAALRRGDLPWLAGAVLCGGLLAPVLLMLGLARTPGSVAALLLNFEAVFTAVLGWSLFRENLDRRFAAGVGAIALGGAALAWGGPLGWSGAAGPLAVLGAGLCWALDNNLTREIAGRDPVQIGMLKGLAAGGVNVALAFALGAAWPTVARAGAALALGVASYGLSLVLFVLALRHLGSARTGAWFALAPFVGAAVAIPVLGEPVSRGFATGAVLMAAGVWLLVTERHQHPHRHPATLHEHAHVHDAHHRHAHEPGDPPGEPHAHPHRHEELEHAHPHYPDLHHRHEHG